MVSRLLRALVWPLSEVGSRVDKIGQNVERRAHYSSGESRLSTALCVLSRSWGQILSDCPPIPVQRLEALLKGSKVFVSILRICWMKNNGFNCFNLIPKIVHTMDRIEMRSHSGFGSITSFPVLSKSWKQKTPIRRPSNQRMSGF